MAKILISPLFIALLFLLPLQIWLMLKLWKGGRVRKILLALSVATLLALLFLSTPSGSQSVYSLLYQKGADELVCPKDLVVVLSGGYFRGTQEDDDQLNGETALRVLKGINLFNRCNLGTIIMSGRLSSGKKERQSELMRDLAIHMGIPKDHILLETDSTNTREHPIYLSKMDAVKADSEIAVVTSPWHLKRAMIEFRRYFSHVLPVSAYHRPKGFCLTLNKCLPQANSLADSAKLLHELVGMAWYHLRSL